MMSRYYFRKIFLRRRHFSRELKDEKAVALSQAERTPCAKAFRWEQAGYQAIMCKSHGIWRVMRVQGTMRI